MALTPRSSPGSASQVPVTFYESYVCLGEAVYPERWNDNQVFRSLLEYWNNNWTSKNDCFGTFSVVAKNCLIS